MTLIVASVWGGRFGFVTDRRISRGVHNAAVPVDEEAAKLLVVRCANSLFAVSYTGVAVALGTWLDQKIASCLAFKRVKPAMIQPGSFFLGRPLHELLRNLAFNLPIRLRKQPGALAAGLTLAVGGWHLTPRLKPFVCELILAPGSLQIGGAMAINWFAVAKHFRMFPGGLWVQSWGDEDAQFEATLRALGNTNGFTHDDVERYIVQAVVQRGRRTQTVGSSAWPCKWIREIAMATFNLRTTQAQTPKTPTRTCPAGCLLLPQFTRQLEKAPLAVGSRVAGLT